MKQSALFVNDGLPAILEDAMTANEGGRIYAANAARFTEATFSEPLTAFAVGWRDESKLQDLVDFIAPAVPVSRRFEYIEFINPEQFQLDASGDDIRSIGGSFPRVEYTQKKTLGNTKNKGLTIRVDMDNVEDMPLWREIYTARLMARLLRNEAYRAVSILSAAATNNAKTWSSGTPNPDGDARTATISFADVVGMHPTRALYGQTAWARRQIGYEIQATAGAFAGAPRKPEDLADFLGLDQVLVSRERYETGTYTAPAKTQMVANLVIFFLASQNMTPEDPSNIKRFISQTQGGTPFRVFEQIIDAKRTDITVEHYSDVVATSTLGVQQLTIS